MLAVSELVERLDVIGRLDAVIGPIKQRRRGHTGGQLLVGMAAAQLAGEDFLVGLDRQRVDTAGQHLGPVAGLCATTAAGLARRFTDTQWAAVETGLGDVHAAALTTLTAVAPARAAALTERLPPQCRGPEVRRWSRHSRRRVPMKRSAIAFARGALIGVRIIRMSGPTRTASKDVVNLLSRSRSGTGIGRRDRRDP
jgi:hypothetical protein